MPTLPHVEEAKSLAIQVFSESEYKDFCAFIDLVQTNTVRRFQPIFEGHLNGMLSTLIYRLEKRP